MEQPTFLILDIEASGLVPSFDQIIQFAAIRVNMNMEIVEKTNILVRPRPDVIPSPGAQIIHRIPIKKALAEGISEYKAALQIHEVMNRPGTISLGFNSMVFDNNMLRFTFYRNLLDPYSHQYRNGCRQMDLLPMIIYCYHYCRDQFQWPINDKGLTSFKLEDLARANGILNTDQRAHDAEADTLTAYLLLKRLRKDKDLWHYISGFFDKVTDNTRLADFPAVLQSNFDRMSRIDHMAGFHIHPRYSDSNFQAPLVSLGGSIAYSNQSLWLQIGDPDFQTITENNFRDRTKVLRKKPGDHNFILPANPNANTMPPERVDLAKKNLMWILNRPKLFEEIVRYHREYRYPTDNDIDPDAELYSVGFMSDREKMLAANFHAAKTAKEKLAIEFPRPVHNELARRIVWRNAGWSAPGPVQDSIKRTMANLINGKPQYDYKGQTKIMRPELPGIISAAAIENDLDKEQKGMLFELEKYTEHLFGSNGNSVRDVQGDVVLERYWQTLGMLQETASQVAA